MEPPRTRYVNVGDADGRRASKSELPFGAQGGFSNRREFRMANGSNGVKVFLSLSWRKKWAGLVQPMLA